MPRAKLSLPRTALVLGMTASVALPSPGWAVDAPSGQGRPASESARQETGRPANEILRDRIRPQLDFLFAKLVEEKGGFTLDGQSPFRADDKFLPGKIAAGMGDVVLALPKGDAKLDRYLRDFADIADLTVGMDNHTWGIYYYVSTLAKLKNAGLLERAVNPATLAKLKSKLDWRHFVRVPSYELIDLPTNYYGVAFSIARLRMLLGWEDESASVVLMDRMLKHYANYSGSFGFSDETPGDGRFDRYSILLIAEICERFVETGMDVTPELKGMLRRAADVALRIANIDGEGFSFGRSIGPYGDNAVLEILSISAYLDVLSAEEKQYAYAYVCRILERYADFWYDPAMHSVNMWERGRRTDGYRGKNRILGENFSLLHQFITTNELWLKAGFADTKPKADLQAWLDKTQPRFSLIWFARGDYDRALAIVRDHRRVFSLLMVNGGPGQHANGPYYPLPFSNGVISGVPDSGYAHPQLLPKFTLADGNELLGTSYIKAIDTRAEGGAHIVSYHQDELDKLGKNVPEKDARLHLQTEYRFEPGVITRTDTYTPTTPLQVDRVSLEFASFSEDAVAEKNRIHFRRGAVTDFRVSGLDRCEAEKAPDTAQFRTPVGALKSHVTCASEKFTLQKPLTIQWTIRYQ